MKWNLGSCVLAFRINPPPACWSVRCPSGLGPAAALRSHLHIATDNENTDDLIRNLRTANLRVFRALRGGLDEAQSCSILQPRAFNKARSPFGPPMCPAPTTTKYVWPLRR